MHYCSWLHRKLRLILRYPSRWCGAERFNRISLHDVGLFCQRELEILARYLISAVSLSVTWQKHGLPTVIVGIKLKSDNDTNDDNTSSASTCVYVRVCVCSCARVCVCVCVCAHPFISMCFLSVPLSTWLSVCCRFRVSVAFPHVSKPAVFLLLCFCPSTRFHIYRSVDQIPYL